MYYWLLLLLPLFFFRKYFFTYIGDRIRFLAQSYPIVTRSDGKGDYFWVKGKDAKEGMRQIKKQLTDNKVKWCNSRGGVYIYDPQIAREVYEAFSQAGFPIAVHCKIGKTYATIIDT